MKALIESDTPRPVGRGFLSRCKNLAFSTRLPWMVAYATIPFQSPHRRPRQSGGFDIAGRIDVTVVMGVAL